MLDACRAARKPRQRHKNQLQRLHRVIVKGLRVDPRLVMLGPDRLFRHLMSLGNAKPPSHIALQVMVEGKPLTLVAIPDRIWHRDAPMRQIFEAKLQVAQLGRECLLLPQRTFSSGSADVRWTDILRAPGQDRVFPSPPGCMNEALAARITMGRL